MSSYRSEFMQVMAERGFLHQCTDAEALDAKLAGSAPVTAYIGFDATADSLHAGSLLPIMMLRWLQETGHRPIVLMGGGTTRIGDPSFKDEARVLMDDAQIAANIQGIGQVFGKYLRFGDGPTDARMVNNADWLDRLEYIPFLRDIGRHFTINRMLTFESVKLRLDREQPLTFLEFNYMILQAYDFAELAKRENCLLQMGGSDQWGNIVSGIDLGRRLLERELYGLTAPLLTTAGGAKMGKTAAGAIWLNADKLSPYDFYQYWRNAADADVGRFLKLFTMLPMDEISRLAALAGAELNEAKKILAFEATKLCHGAAAAAEAQETAAQTFGGPGIAEGLPTFEVARARLENGMPVIEALRIAGLAESNGAARRLIKGGGARLNDTKVESEEAVVTVADIIEGGVVKLSSGRKRHALLKAV